jgi:hypothetical protein
MTRSRDNFKLKRVLKVASANIRQLKNLHSELYIPKCREKNFTRMGRETIRDPETSRIETGFRRFESIPTGPNRPERAGIELGLTW